MALAPNPFPFRRIQDEVLKANLVLPNANATTYSGAIDLGTPTLSITNESISLIANIPNIPNVPNAAVQTYTVEHADANANANFSSLGITLTVTGGATGVLAQLLEAKLPGHTKQFVRLKALGGSGAGTTIAETAKVEIRT